MNIADPQSLGDGQTIWLTGRPGAGKSAIARGVAAQLLVEGHRVQVLGIDDMRRNVTGDHGFSRADRMENVRRIAFVALMLATQGVIAVVPVNMPDEASRADVRRRHIEHGVGYIEVRVAAARGVGDPTRPNDPVDRYGPPTGPDLLIPPHRDSVRESVDRVLEFLRPQLRG